MQKDKKAQRGAGNVANLEEKRIGCLPKAQCRTCVAAMPQSCQYCAALKPQICRSRVAKVSQPILRQHAKGVAECRTYVAPISPSIHIISNEILLLLPVMEGGLSAGFPSPTRDFLDASIDLNQYLIKHPSTTFLAITSGFSMKDAGIHDKDILIIDKSLEPTDGKIAVCIIDGEFVLKRLKVDKLGIWLMPANPSLKPMRINEFQDFEIWGIVTYSIQKH
jgi:DNA polymerase V